MSHNEGMRADGTGDHPEAMDLQRFADGDIVSARDESLIRHVERCDTCAAEVERLRNSAAALALASQPPDDLYDRIKARRARGERVLLPFESDTASAAEASPRDWSQGERAPAASRRWRARNWAVAAAAVVVIGGILVWQRGTGPEVVADGGSGTGQSTAVTPGPRPGHDSVVGPGHEIDPIAVGWRSLSPAVRRQRWLSIKQTLLRIQQSDHTLLTVDERGDSLVAPLASMAFVDDTLTRAAHHDLFQVGTLLVLRAEFRVLVLGVTAAPNDAIEDLRLRTRMRAVAAAVMEAGVQPSRVNVTTSRVATPQRESLQMAIVVLRPTLSSDGR